MEYAKNHSVVYAEWTNFMAYELDLNRVVKNEKNVKRLSDIHTSETDLETSLSHGRRRAPEHTLCDSSEAPGLATLTHGDGKLSSSCLCWMGTE